MLYNFFNFFKMDTNKTKSERLKEARLVVVPTQKVPAFLHTNGTHVPWLLQTGSNSVP